jgi:hypothetical protein
MISPLSHLFIYCWLVQYCQESEGSWCCASHEGTTVTAFATCWLDISALLLTTEHIIWLGCLIFKTHTFSKPVNVIDLWDIKRKFYDWLIDLCLCVYVFVFPCLFVCVFVCVCLFVFLCVCVCVFSCHFRANMYVVYMRTCSFSYF